MRAPPLFKTHMRNQNLSEEQLNSALGAVAHAGLNLMTLCEEAKDPVFGSRLYDVLEELRVANAILLGVTNE